MHNSLLIMGDPALYQLAKPVTDFTDPKIKTIIDKMCAVQSEHQGAGIAAPQLGYSLRIILVGFDHVSRYPDQPAVPVKLLINPEFEALDDEKEYGWEGCLSLPGMRGLVPRYKRIQYRGYDENGHLIEEHAQDFHARVIQHEIDHLDGILYPMRIENMQDFGCESAILEHRYK